MTPNELEARKKKKPYRQTDLRRRKYRKVEEEEHAMDKPKTLEAQTDGDLTEIKKDPVWKTFLEKRQHRIESGKRVKLGDLKQYKLPKGQKGAKHKEVKEQTKIGWRKPLKKRGEDMGDKIIHPTEDKDWKKRLKPSTLEYLREPSRGVNPKRPDVNVQDRMEDESGKPKVEHPQSGTPGMKPVREGDEPQRTTPSGLYGPMGAGETYVHPKTGKVGAPIQRAMIQLVKFSLRRKKPKIISTRARPTGIPESPGNVDDRKVPKPEDASNRKITRAPRQIKPQTNVAHEGKAEPKLPSTVGVGGKKTSEREQEETNVAMGKLEKPKKTTSPIENIERSVDAYLLWKRDLDETGESDINQQKGEKIQAHPPLGEEEYKYTDSKGNEKTGRRKIVKPADKPHKVVDPLHPYTEVSGGFVQNEKVPNLIDSDQNVLGQTPGKHDKEVKPSNTSPIKSPKVADPKKRTNVPKAWKSWLEKKISEPDPVKDAPDPNRAIFAKDEEDYKRRKEGLGGKGGCRGVGCDKKATKKLIAWVRDLEAGSTVEKPVMSDRMHKEIINVCPDCHKRAMDWQEQNKKEQENANKTYVTKPIPDSKGGKGSFQHCINANQDKHNPGGWCKQIERKVGKAKKDTWNCSLCNIELPDDELSEKRKKRHADFHKDESLGTGGRQRNWTFGDAEFTLGKQKAWKSWLENKDAKTGKQSTTRTPSGTKSTRGGRGIRDQTSQGQATDARLLDVPHNTSGFNQRKREHSQVGDITIPNIDRKLPDYEPKGVEPGFSRISRAPRPQGQAAAMHHQRREREGKKPYEKRQQILPARGKPEKKKEPTREPAKETPSKYTKEEWNKLPDFFKERETKQIRNIQSKIDVLSQKLPQANTGKKQENWEKIDDAVQSDRAKEIEDRAGRGIPYGKSLWKAWLEKKDDWDRKEKDKRPSKKRRDWEKNIEARDDKLPLGEQDRKGEESEAVYRYAMDYDPKKDPSAKVKPVKDTIVAGKEDIPKKKQIRHEVADARKAWEDKTDYFVEEIRANIIYENKIAPLIGMLAGGVARAVGGVGKKVVQAGREMAKPQQGEEEE